MKKKVKIIMINNSTKINEPERTTTSHLNTEKYHDDTWCWKPGPGMERHKHVAGLRSISNRDYITLQNALSSVYTIAHVLNYQLFFDLFEGTLVAKIMF
jgi:hypothetical protein